MKTIKKQQGFALLIFVAILTTAAAAFAIKVLNNNGNNSQIARDKITAAALAQAKDALIGRAVADDNRPGSLPCPDTNNDGIAELFVGSDCPSYIGRLPWKTLDLPDLRDGAGEHLWYALSDHLKDDNSAQPINSDTRGTLPVYAQDGTTLITNQAVAVIFSPGDVLAGQDRTSVNIASNYLEKSNCPGANCRDNTAAAGPFIAGPVFNANRNPLLNDRLMVIQTKDIIPAVEKRVAKELNSWLQAYYAANANHYPYPAKYDACTAGICPGDTSVCRGRFPSTASAVDTAFPAFPSYFLANQWNREIYYSAGSGFLVPPVPVVAPCAATLTVTGVGNVRAVFFTPGTPIAPVLRTIPNNTLSDYLEDFENQDGWPPGIPNDTYVIPTATTLDRDRLYSLP